MEDDAHDRPRTADEVRQQEEEHELEDAAETDIRHPNDPIGDSAYSGDMMLPPTGDLNDPPPATGLPGEPPTPEADVDDRR